MGDPISAQEDGSVNAEGVAHVSDATSTNADLSGVESAVDDVQPVEGESMSDAIRRATKPWVEKKTKEELGVEGSTEEKPAEKKADEEEKPSEDKKEDKEDKDEDKSTSKVKPPVSWKKEDQELWAKLPDDARKVISERESARDRYLSQKGAEVKTLQDAYNEKVAPYEDLEKEFYKDAKIAGMSVVDLLKDSMGFLRVYREDPVKAIKHLVERRGINLRALADGDEEGAFDTEYNKAQVTNVEHKTQIELLNDKISSLESRLEEKEANVQSDKYLNQVDAWLTTKDTSVIDKISEEDRNAFIATFRVLHSQIKSDNPEAAPELLLDTAWDRATFAIPSVRKKIVARQSAASVQQDLRHTSKVNGSRPLSANGNPSTVVRIEKPMQDTSWSEIFSDAVKKAQER